MASIRWAAIALLALATSASAEEQAAAAATAGAALQEGAATATPGVVNAKATDGGKVVEATAEAKRPDPRSPIGRWKTIDDETGKPRSVVRIWEKDGKLYGTIERLFRSPEEEQNPLCTKCEGELKDKPIIGMTILRDLVRDGDEWEDGTILDPANGKTYDVKIEVQDKGRKLKVRGFLGISLLGRTQYWERVD